MKTETTAYCRNCGKTIVLGPAWPDAYWVHLKGWSVYCNGTTRSAMAKPR